MGLFQDIMEPLVTPISKDCKWNVDVEALANKHSLRLVNSEKRALGHFNWVYTQNNRTSLITYHVVVVVNCVCYLF